MDNIKLVSGKSTSTRTSNRPDRSSETVAAASRQSRPSQSVSAKKAQSSPAPKAPKAKKQKGTGGRKAIIISAVILAVIFAAFAGLGVYANGLETIFPNVSMEGTSLAGLTVAEVTARANEIVAAYDAAVK